jgi:hypothetical protein
MEILFVDFKSKLGKTIIFKQKLGMRVYMRVMIMIMVLAGIVNGATSKHPVCLEHAFPARRHS